MTGEGVLSGTVGVEEEYHLVHPDTFALVHCPGLLARAHADGLGEHLHAEMLTSQLEVVTPVCGTLEEVHAELVRGRRAAAKAAAAVGATILASSTHPFAGADEIEVTHWPRYERLDERFRDVLRINLCGCHVHVGVPDLDTAVAISNRARDYLPLLIALSASSPFYLGRDTGYDSFRLPLLALLPQGGLPPVLRSAEHFAQTVAELRRHGLVEDATGVLWLIRPSTRYATLEFRVTDVCTDVRDTMLIATMIRALVCVLGERIARGPQRSPPAEPELPDPVLRAACWRAARDGMANVLWSPARHDLVPAAHAVGDLVAELRPELAARGELDVVEELLTRRSREGSSAGRQRRVYAARGSLVDVVRDGVQLTARVG